MTDIANYSKNKPEKLEKPHIPSLVNEGEKRNNLSQSKRDEKKTEPSWITKKKILKKNLVLNPEKK